MKQPPKHPMSLLSIIRGLRRSSSAIAPSASIWRSCPPPTAGCLPGFRARPSCCRTSTACRRCCSAWCLRRPRWDIGLGTLMAARLVVPHRHRPHHRVRRGGTRRRRTRDGGRHRAGRDLARRPGRATDGALSLRSRPGHAAIDGGCAHAVSGARRRRLIAARLSAAGDRVRDRHRGRANARIERAAAGRDHRRHGRSRACARAVQTVDGSRLSSLYPA